MSSITVTFSTFILWTLLSFLGLLKPNLPLTRQPNCGIAFIQPILSNSLKNTKIMYGNEARPNSFPWIVSLRAKKYNNVHFCGGVLISNQYVLSAAHCVFGQNASNILIMAGIHYRNGSEIETNLNKTYQVSNFVYHHFYTDFFKSNDVAVLKLEKPIEFSYKMSAICLPSSYKDGEKIFDKNLIAIGWGSINGENAQNSLSNKLQQTSLKVLNDSNLCRRLPYFNNDFMYCARDSNLTKHSNVCYGDSGGPLMYLSEDGKWYTYGVTSMVFADLETNFCNPREPSYFSKVPAYLDWIEEAMEFLEKN